MQRAPRLSYTMQAARTRPDDLWKHCRDPIKAPLLQRLQHNPELFDKAVSIFGYILKVYFEAPSLSTSTPNEIHFFSVHG